MTELTNLLKTLLESDSVKKLMDAAGRAMVARAEAAVIIATTAGKVAEVQGKVAVLQAETAMKVAEVRAPHLVQIAELECELQIATLTKSIEMVNAGKPPVTDKK